MLLGWFSNRSSEQHFRARPWLHLHHLRWKKSWVRHFKFRDMLEHVGMVVLHTAAMPGSSHFSLARRTFFRKGTRTIEIMSHVTSIPLHSQLWGFGLWCSSDFPFFYVQNQPWAQLRAPVTAAVRLRQHALNVLMRKRCILIIRSDPPTRNAPVLTSNVAPISTEPSKYLPFQ